MENIFLKDIVKSVADKRGLSGKDADYIDGILRDAFEECNKQLAAGNKLYLLRFVNLEPKDYKEKKTKHPQTGADFTIPKYRTVIAQPTDHLRELFKEAMKRQP